MGCRADLQPAHQAGREDRPATYYEHRSRQRTCRELRDEQLKPRIAAVHASNYGVYGAQKVWLTLNRQRPEGEAPIARCAVERLMRELGLAGTVRGKVKRTTISDPSSSKPSDLVGRRFSPLAPDRLWVADFTYVSTWSGWWYTAFVIADAKRLAGDEGNFASCSSERLRAPDLRALPTVIGWTTVRSQPACRQRKAFDLR